MSSSAQPSQPSQPSQPNSQPSDQPSQPNQPSLPSQPSHQPNQKTFTKSTRGIAVEFAGLRWLRQAKAVPIVKVVEYNSNELILEHLTAIPATPKAAREFGELLAKMHDAGASAFGAPPSTWTAPTGFIGTATLTFTHDSRWGRFYAEHRLMPYTRKLNRLQRAEIEKLSRKLIDGLFDDDAPPARIHGDLWHGNVIFTDAGATLIDPAAHGGHRITDLAMLALFGAPHLEEIYKGYESTSSHLPANWRELITLHQIHPLLVHHVLFSGSYGDEAVVAAQQYL